MPDTPAAAPDRPGGVLFVVATPIGNLEDITLRALRVLREADVIAAEDTRHTARLLRHFGIRTPTTSFHEHNEAARTGALVARLLAGARIALVSDAGTPGVSDPGFRLVRAAVEAGIRVEAIPGASAVVAALACAGLPTDTFVFVGFPPAREGARRAWFEALRAERRTIVLYEAPHRVAACLATAFAVLGDRPAAVARELTKLHEEILRGRLSDIVPALGPGRGEYTVVLGGATDEAGPAERQQPSDTHVLLAFEAAIEQGLDRRAAIGATARKFGLRSREAYLAVERARSS